MIFPKDESLQSMIYRVLLVSNGFVKSEGLVTEDGLWRMYPQLEAREKLLFQSFSPMFLLTKTIGNNEFPYPKETIFSDAYEVYRTYSYVFLEPHSNQSMQPALQERRLNPLNRCFLKK